MIKTLVLKKIGVKINEIPKDFILHPTIKKIFERFWTDTLINKIYISYGTSAIFGGT